MESGRRHRRWRGGRLLASSLLVCLLAFVLPPFPERYSDLRASVPAGPGEAEAGGIELALWVPLEELPPELLKAVLTRQDNRYYSHPGVDPFAIVRAVRDNLEAGRIVSGASTITSQLLRTFDPPGRRGLADKLFEAYWALRLEGRTSKDELLEAYLNRASFGPRVVGAESASRYYFAKSARSLTLSEATALAVLLRCTVDIDPFSEDGQDRLRGWTDELLQRMENNSVITPEAARNARAETWQLSTGP